MVLMTASRLASATSNPSGMWSAFGFVEFKKRRRGDDHLAMLEVVLQRLLQRQHTRFIVDQASSCTLSGLKRGVLVELIEYLPGLRTALELNDDAHTAPVGLVAHVGNSIVALRARAPRCAQSGWSYLAGTEFP